MAEQRIVVVGTTGSGKTSFAARLARALGVRHIELDALHWEPDWREAPDGVFRKRVQAATATGGWVVDGNYSIVRDIVWGRADTVIWLDYGIFTILFRLVRRTFRRAFTREVLWNGNRERFLTSFFSRESILLWALKTYWVRKRNYPRVLSLPEHSHLQVVRLCSPREAERWLTE